MKAPLHERIGADIEARIMSGDWRPGHRIPVEHELMAHYGCARMTVSKALSRLAAAGLIERRKRVGSFVAVPVAHRATLEIPDIRSEILRRGASYGLDLLSRAVRAPDADDKAQLAMANGSVLALGCRHMAGGMPFAVEERLINLNAVPEAVAVDFGVEPPGSWLIGHIPLDQRRASHQRCRCWCGRCGLAGDQSRGAVPDARTLDLV